MFQTVYTISNRIHNRYLFLTIKFFSYPFFSYKDEVFHILNTTDDVFRTYQSFSYVHISNLVSCLQFSF
jgi:hypothetical protein